MRTISKQVYEELGGIHSSPNLGLTTEKRWYKHDTLLGIVLIDNVDNDWSFVALAPDARKPHGCAFRAFDVGTSFERIEQAEAALDAALATGPDAGFFTEAV